MLPTAVIKFNILCAEESIKIILKEAKNFTIIADEISEISRNRFQLLIHYVQEDANIHYNFLNFRHAERTTGVVLAM